MSRTPSFSPATGRARLRKENAELAMDRVLKRSVVLWVKDAMGR